MLLLSLEVPVIQGISILHVENTGLNKTSFFCFTGKILKWRQMLVLH